MAKKSTIKNFLEYEASVAFDFVAKFEGLKLKAYKCPANVWTIGYGHTQGVREGDKITNEEAEMMLIEDLNAIARQVARYINMPVSEGQFIALLSFAFNCGVNALARSSILRYLNQGEINRAADSFLLWNKAGGKVMAGLVKRREAERELFLK